MACPFIQISRDKIGFYATYRYKCINCGVISNKAVPEKWLGEFSLKDIIYSFCKKFEKDLARKHNDEYEFLVYRPKK